MEHRPPSKFQNLDKVKMEPVNSTIATFISEEPLLMLKEEIKTDEFFEIEKDIELKASTSPTTFEFVEIKDEPNDYNSKDHLFRSNLRTTKKCSSGTLSTNHFNNSLFWDKPKSRAARILDDSDSDDISSEDESGLEDVTSVQGPLDPIESSDYDESDNEMADTLSNCEDERTLPVCQTKKFEGANHKISFSGGSTYTGQPVREPIEYFRDLVDGNILSHLVSESNKYALQCEYSLDLNQMELEKFIGIIFMMCIIKMSDSRMYWDTKMRYDNVANVMPSNRFQIIKRYLHCNDNATRPENCTDKLYQIRPLIEALVAKLKKNIPTEHLMVDEQFVPFKGASSIKLYNPKKSKKFGYKIFILSGSDGLIYNFDIFTGSSSPCPGQPDIKSPGNNVLKLLQEIPRNASHKVYCNNLFTSLPLATTLLSHGIVYTGTAQANRLQGCKLQSDAELAKRGRGSMVVKTIVSDGGNVKVVKWFNKQVVLLVTTYEKVVPRPIRKISKWNRSSSSKSKVEINCPDVLDDYYKFMGISDLLNNLVASHRNSIRSRKWYHRLIFHLFDMMLVQAWNRYRADLTLSGITNKRKHMKLRNFKFEVGYCLANENKVTKRQDGPSLDVDELQRKKVRLGGSGATMTIPPKAVRTDEVGHWPLYVANKRLRCKYPSCRLKSCMTCSKCNVNLCLNVRSNCFRKFHE